MSGDDRPELERLRSLAERANRVAIKGEHQLMEEQGELQPAARRPYPACCPRAAAAAAATDPAGWQTGWHPNLASGPRQEPGCSLQWAMPPHDLPPAAPAKHLATEVGAPLHCSAHPHTLMPRAGTNSDLGTATSTAAQIPPSSVPAAARADSNVLGPAATSLVSAEAWLSRSGVLDRTKAEAQSRQLIAPAAHRVCDCPLLPELACCWANLCRPGCPALLLLAESVGQALLDLKTAFPL